MCDYKGMYFKLFKGITDEISVLEKEIEKLKSLQMMTEEMYISQAEARVTENEKQKSDP